MPDANIAIKIYRTTTNGYKKHQVMSHSVILHWSSGVSEEACEAAVSMGMAGVCPGYHGDWSRRLWCHD